MAARARGYYTAQDLPVNGHGNEMVGIFSIESNRRIAPGVRCLLTCKDTLERLAPNLCNATKLGIKSDNAVDDSLDYNGRCGYCSVNRLQHVAYLVIVIPFQLWR